MTAQFSHEMPVRYRDLDPNNHVNNAVYASYFEEARIAYHQAVLDREPEEYSLVLAGLEIDFEREVRHGETIRTTVETVAMGTSSWTTEYELFVDGERGASGSATTVHVDPERREPAPIPEDIRTAIEDYEGL